LQPLVPFTDPENYARKAGCNLNFIYCISILIVTEIEVVLLVSIDSLTIIFLTIIMFFLEIVAKESGALHTNQFENTSNFSAHYEGTGYDCIHN